MEPIEEKSVGIIGWRKLIFGLTSLISITLVESLITGGWSKWGIGGIVAVTALFYGPPVLKELTKLVAAWRNKA